MPKTTRGDVTQLLTLVERLRAPGGCPWDREQTFADIRSYLVEEAHEVAAAIDCGDWQALRGELGDLLFQVCFLAVLAAEQDRFVLADAVAAVHTKMVERHPHVFDSSPGGGLDAEQVAQLWEKRKLVAAAGARGSDTEGAEGGLLAGVPTSLPALVGAYRLSQKAAGVGFDWRHTDEILDKIDEELDELRAVLRAPAEAALPGDAAADPSRLEEEVGDLLFAASNLARRLRIDPERALARANLKFRRRFAHVERGIAGAHAAGAPPEALRQRMEELWEEAKRSERDQSPPVRSST
ncbi:MAG TPA: nucleoside triphosphate pyrophosphohydrolase [Thermoanaerobaculia bacterium]|nr:nucleoside triphosphate pyrophosphohydrolase [Thermoanaerobaculia bacterium]